MREFHLGYTGCRASGTYQLNQPSHFSYPGDVYASEG